MTITPRSGRAWAIAALAYTCPTCAVPAGEGCRSLVDGEPQPKFHIGRVEPLLTPA